MITCAPFHPLPRRQAAGVPGWLRPEELVCPLRAINALPISLSPDQAASATSLADKARAEVGLPPLARTHSHSHSHGHCAHSHECGQPHHDDGAGECGGHTSISVDHTGADSAEPRGLWPLHVVQSVMCARVFAFAHAKQSR